MLRSLALILFSQLLGHARLYPSLLFFSLFFFSHLTFCNISNTQNNFRFTSLEAIELERIGIQFSIAEDSQGFMWYGGSTGLARFDGYDVKIYRNDPNNPNSISHNQIQALLSDSQGRLWVATTYGLNLYDRNTDSFIKYFADDYPSALPSNSINRVKEDTLGNIWVGTSKGLAKIDGKTLKPVPLQLSFPAQDNFLEKSVWELVLSNSGDFWICLSQIGLVLFDPESQTYSYPKDNNKVSRNILIYAIAEDKEGWVWLGTSDDGLIGLNPTTGKSKTFKHIDGDPSSLHHNTIWNIFIDQENNYWISSDDSLELFSPNTGAFIHYPYLDGTDRYGKVRSIFSSKSGDLWLGLFPTGTAYLDRDAMAFRNFQSSRKDNDAISNSAVTSLAKDKHGNYWVGTENGLNYFNPKTNKFKKYFHIANDPTSLPTNSILSLLIDKFGTLWVGTWKGGWVRFNPEDDSFIRPVMDDGSTKHLTSEIWHIHEDRSGALWLGGLYKYNRERDTFIHYEDLYPNGDKLPTSFVSVNYEDSHGIFWIGTAGGLAIFDKESGKLILHLKDKNTEGNINDNHVMSITEDSKGNIYFGTQNGGINRYDRHTQKFSTLDDINEHVNSAVTGLLFDKQDNLWALTGNGLIRKQKENSEIQLYNRNNGLSGDLFHRNAIYLNDDGILIFGGTFGLTLLDPNLLETNEAPPPIVITSLEVFNKEVTTNNSEGTLSKAINVADKIQLKYNENVITLRYAALNYRLSNLNQYAYKLEGFDKDWNYVGNNRSVTYTNLDPGEYTFKVKGSNNSEVWNEEGAQVRVSVLPPWWHTTPAYILYCVVTILLISTIAFVFHRFREAQNQLIINHQLKQVDKLKDAFMANTSHELRTPLNGIIGLTEWVISNNSETLKAESLRKLNLVANSGKRLSNIVNDILDFSKLKNHEVELKKSPINLHALVQATFDLSETLAKDKGVTFINQVDRELPSFYADEQRLGQILDNLVGNAIKFTTNGKVSVSAKSSDEHINIHIRDEGIGISESDIKRIFLPFEQAILGTENKSVGTGLGLAVTKKLVELHGGKISVMSQKGKGATFTVQLPFVSAKALLSSAI